MGLASTNNSGRMASALSLQRTWTGPTRGSYYVVCSAQGSGQGRTRRSLEKIEPRRRSQAPSSQTGVERTLSAVETVALGGAVLSHAVSTKSNEPSNGSSNTSVFFTSFVLAALVIRKVASTLSERKREGSPTSQAMLRLRNVEKSLEDQGKVLDSVVRQVDALKTRTRFVGRDVRTTMKQVETTSALTGDVLQDTAARMELLEGRMSDVEVLIGSVHEVVSKQLTLISDVVMEQKSLSKKIAQSATANKSTKDSKPILETKADGDHTTHSSSSIDHSTEGVGKDEWGRQTISGVLPRNETARRDSRDGSILFSFDSN